MHGHYLTVAAAADKLALSPHAVLALIASGALPAANVSSGSRRPRWRIDPAALSAWMASRQSRPEVRPVRRRRSSVQMIEFV